ncbi:MAG: DUF3011 domain-containing protein [Bdellovibrionales bacterium]|nr:DUF3011 domain-containing protein [Bdellovibrionales bacterium]
MNRFFLFGAIVSGWCLAAIPAAADETITCESQNEEREYCRVRHLGDREVSLEQKLSKRNCKEGKSWGVGDRGIWVSDGCRAKFRVSSYRDQDYARGYGRDYDRDYDRGSYRGDRDDYSHDRGRHRGGRDYGYDHNNSDSFRVSQNLNSERSWVGPRLEIPRINKIRVHLRRTNPRQTDTKVSVGFDDNTQLAVQQVDNNNMQWLEFDANGARTHGRKIVVTAHAGDVFIDRVSVE